MGKNYYINIRSYDNLLALTYLLPKRLRYQESLETAFTDLKNIKNRILEFVRGSTNEKVILKNTERIEEGDKPFNNKELEKLCQNLNKEVPNITFKLAA